MTRKQARLYGILVFMLGLGTATGLTLTALSSSISYFRTPTEIVSGQYPEKNSNRAFRIGGLVEQGSLRHVDQQIIFRVTDLKNTLTVSYGGVIPDLFREGQGVIAEGRMNAEQVFVAQTLLAKHDEKYMPPEVARALKTSGMTRQGTAP